MGIPNIILVFIAFKKVENYYRFWTRKQQDIGFLDLGPGCDREILLEPLTVTTAACPERLKGTRTK